jgi:hypothetical protein
LFDDELEKNVSMMSSDHAKGISPYLMFLKGLEIPLSSGEVEDFIDWKINIRQCLDVLGDQGKLPNAMKLELLSRALDPDNKNILQAHREKGGGYEEFMKSIDGRYMNDVQEYHRKKMAFPGFPESKKDHEGGPQGV